jgi:hypothetical protein
MKGLSYILFQLSSFLSVVGGAPSRSICHDIYSTALEFNCSRDSSFPTAVIWYGCRGLFASQEVRLESNIHCTGIADPGMNWVNHFKCSGFDRSTDFSDFLSLVETLDIVCEGGEEPVFHYSSQFGGTKLPCGDAKRGTLPTKHLTSVVWNSTLSIHTYSTYTTEMEVGCDSKDNASFSAPTGSLINDTIITSAPFTLTNPSSGAHTISLMVSSFRSRAIHTTLIMVLLITGCGLV